MGEVNGRSGQIYRHGTRKITLSHVSISSLAACCVPFSGHIPATLGELKALEELALSRNELSGKVPPNEAPCRGSSTFFHEPIVVVPRQVLPCSSVVHEAGKNIANQRASVRRVLPEKIPHSSYRSHRRCCFIAATTLKKRISPAVRAMR